MSDQLSRSVLRVANDRIRKNKKIKKKHCRVWKIFVQGGQLAIHFACRAHKKAIQRALEAVKELKCKQCNRCFISEHDLKGTSTVQGASQEAQEIAEATIDLL